MEGVFVFAGVKAYEKGIAVVLCLSSGGEGNREIDRGRNRRPRPPFDMLPEQGRLVFPPSRDVQKIKS